MRFTFVSQLVLFLPSVLSAPQAVIRQQPFNDLNPYPTKPKLTFRDDGTFKLMVFSDLHFGENPWDDWGPEQDVNSTRVMNIVLADEKPDYVVINGDLITGENTFKENATSLIDEIVAPLNAAKVPFSSIHGNHDNDLNITHILEIQREQQVAPLSYTRAAPPGVGGENGPGNYWVPIYAKATDAAPALVLWFFDSRSGHSPTTDRSQLPDYVDDSVADYIKSEVEKMDAAWGPSEERNALAFVHIPPFVIQELQNEINSTENPGLNDDALGPGGGAVESTLTTVTDGDVPFYNSLTANVKNLRAIVSGHDHGDEWCAREKTKDVIFCFAKHTGYGGYDSPDWGHGVREFLFSSTSPKDGLQTWIHLEEGETRAEVVLDDKYGR